jgi:hypothetical protein
MMRLSGRHPPPSEEHAMTRPHATPTIRTPSRRAPTPLTETVLRRTVGLATGWFLARVIGLEDMVGQV